MFTQSGARRTGLAAIFLIAGFAQALCAAAIHKSFVPADFVGPRPDPEHPHAIDRPEGSDIEEGTAILTFRVLKDGSVANVVVTQSSGYADLDAAAVNSVSGWHYLPATKGGKPVDADYQAKADFRSVASPPLPGEARAHTLNDEILDMKPADFVARCGKDQGWCESHVANSVHVDASNGGACPPKGMSASAMTAAMLQYMRAHEGDWDNVPALMMLAQGDSATWPCP